MHLVQKTIILNIDSIGVGDLPDSSFYAIQGASNLSNLSKKIRNIKLPNLANLGLGNITVIDGLERKEDTIGFYGKIGRASDGTDTRIGHWELSGLKFESLFYTNYSTFFDDFMSELSRRTGQKFLYRMDFRDNSIINLYYSEHISEKQPLVFVDKMGTVVILFFENLFTREAMETITQHAQHLCEYYGILQLQIQIFNGSFNNFTSLDAQNYYLTNKGVTLFDGLSPFEIPVYSIAKNNFFTHKNIQTIKSENDIEALNKLIQLLDIMNRKKMEQAFIYIHLTDLIDIYIKNNDIKGYATHLEELDKFLSKIFRAMNTADMLFITSTSSCDPVLNHKISSREYFPLIVYSRILQVRSRGNIGVRRSLLDISDTISDIYSLDYKFGGDSFWSYMVRHV